MHGNRMHDSGIFKKSLKYFILDDQENWSENFINVNCALKDFRSIFRLIFKSFGKRRGGGVASLFLSFHFLHLVLQHRTKYYVHENFTNFKIFQKTLRKLL